MKEVCFILDDYPEGDSDACIFAKNLIEIMADSGIKCTVIAPQILIPSAIKKYGLGYQFDDVTENGNTIHVYKPVYVYLTSNKYLIGFSMRNHYKSVLNIIRKNQLRPDFIYGHFIYQCGLTAAKIGKKMNVPSFCACGESSSRIEADSGPYSVGFKYGRWKEIIELLDGMICVSSYNKQLLEQRGYLNPCCRVAVIPNGVNHLRFHNMDKRRLRNELGFPQDAFIVAFVGAFTERKGYLKLCEALNSCEDVFSVLIGKGSQCQNVKNNLFTGSVNNDKVALYLNASDIFVLPTIGEGCSNAIAEALACGLPVVSSNLPFNDDILDDNNSIRIDVTDVQEIIRAIKLLKYDELLRNKLADGARETGELLDLNRRAEKIVRFMRIDK